MGHYASGLIGRETYVVNLSTTYPYLLNVSAPFCVTNHVNITHHVTFTRLFVMAAMLPCPLSTWLLRDRQ